TGVVRNPVGTHPGIRIWGTLEARVQGVELVVLGGLNEGTWPEAPAPDPWMNRAMRKAAGLLLPERRIGLAAHDFQQAIGAARVVLTRAVRDDEAPTLPARWLNRLTNLLEGMSDEGRSALRAARARGAGWLDLAERLDAVPEAERLAPAPRPSPCPPLDARPKRLSVTAMTRLVRDPYAIYARHVLELSPLAPLHQTPDAPLRGSSMHAIMERFVREAPAGETLAAARVRLLETAREVFEAEAPWPAARILWMAKLARIAEPFLRDEVERQSRAHPFKQEVKGTLTFPEVDFTLSAKADRIDRDESGALYIYDYKTGQIPGKNERKLIDRQLPLEALMARAGAFEGIPPSVVVETAYIGIGAKPVFERSPVTEEDIDETRRDLLELIGKYRIRSRGYTSRRLVRNVRWEGDYDHLARFGEWDHATPPTPVEVGP
ncbi:MAG: double-strand break repair protein AddB, partial [Alphaproteobacteria bacterium]